MRLVEPLPHGTLDGTNFVTRRRQQFGVACSPSVVTAQDCIRCGAIPNTGHASPPLQGWANVVAPSGGRDALIPRGPQVIVRLLPLVGRDPQYQVHSTVDGHDRVVLESQIMLIEERPAPVVQKVAAKKSAPGMARRRSR